MTICLLSMPVNQTIFPHSISPYGQTGTQIIGNVISLHLVCLKNEEYLILFSVYKHYGY